MAERQRKPRLSVEITQEQYDQIAEWPQGMKSDVMRYLVQAVVEEVAQHGAWPVYNKFHGGMYDLTLTEEVYDVEL